MRGAEPERDGGGKGGIVAEICARTGCDVFTVLHYDVHAGLARRVFSSLADAFAAEGTKPLAGAPWAEHVLGQCTPLVCCGAEAIEKVFDDHAVILARGITGIINVPILEGERCLGAVNCLYLGTPLPEEGGFPAAEISRCGLALLKAVPDKG